MSAFDLWDCLIVRIIVGFAKKIGSHFAGLLIPGLFPIFIRKGSSSAMVHQIEYDVTHMPSIHSRLLNNYSAQAYALRQGHVNQVILSRDPDSSAASPPVLIPRTSVGSLVDEAKSVHNAYAGAVSHCGRRHEEWGNSGRSNSGSKKARSNSAHRLGVLVSYTNRFLDHLHQHKISLSRYRFDFQDTADTLAIVNRDVNYIQ
ncbi:hypothetical protein Ct61P_14527 [Colletotrichum tofieldiae]|nr:hypothetical protein Ct61P_14527 [Colletotrichum tofieldiae]